jgi:hypothetical protein
VAKGNLAQAKAYNKESNISWMNVATQKYIPQIITFIPVLSTFFFR